jgi:predicted HicB family RNase H-like nuclease
LAEISEERKKAIADYKLNTYDRLEIKVKKGEKAELKQHAAEQGESLNGFVNRAMEETRQRDKQRNA